MFAHVTNGTVDSVGNPPQLVFAGERWWDLRDRDPVTLALVGWYPVQEATRPADTATNTSTPVFTFNGTLVVQSWTVLPKTAEQLATEAAETALNTIRAAVRVVITDVKSYKDTLDAAFIDSATGQPATNPVINASPAKFIKDTQRAVERTMRAVIDLAKLVDGRV